MRDSELAIGTLVLLGVIAALLYFLFPNEISRFLRGPSHKEIYRSIDRETAAFSAETETISSYLEDSWSMKAYRAVDSALKRNGYPGWIKTVKAERDALLSNTLRKAERQSKTADRIFLALKSKKSLRESIKNSRVRMNTQALDNEIAALQTQLDRGKNSLLKTLERFSKRRRSLNQKALREWFTRSMLVAFLIALFLSASYWLITPSPNPSGSQRAPSYPARESSESRIFSFFRLKASYQPVLSNLGEGPVLRDSTFRLTIEPKTGTIPQPIASALKGLPKTNTALKLASILGGYPDTPASRSHHLSQPGGLIIHTAKALIHCEHLLTYLPNPQIGPVVILAHDIGKVLTLNSQGVRRPHDIPAADILASLPELKEDFNDITIRSILLAVRHQHSNAEIPLNAPSPTQAIMQFIKKADFAAVAEEGREAAEKIKALSSSIINAFPFVIPDLNVNDCKGGRSEGFLSDGYVFLLKEPVKEKLLKHLNSPDAPVFKGQDPVWNEMAQALSEAGLITTKIATKEAGKRSCLFTIKTPLGQEKAIVLHASNVTSPLREKWLGGNIPKIEVV